MSANDKYLSPQLQRAFRLVELMAGNEINGVAPSELAKAIQATPADITRILANLERAGWAEKLPTNTKRWRLHKKPVQLSNTVEQHFRSRLRELHTEATNYDLLG